MVQEARHEVAMENQGFEDPTDESPIDVPDGWTGGAVQQTGGMIMVRKWWTHDGIGVVGANPGEQYEYEVAYGQDPGVSLNRYEWDPDAHDDDGSYEWAGDVVVRELDEETANTDGNKAAIARELMVEFSRDADPRA
jgi:hypothetical protein